MIDCPECMAQFRGLECECGYKVPPPSRAPLPFGTTSETEQEIERRRERVAELKKQFFGRGTA